MDRDIFEWKSSYDYSKTALSVDLVWTGFKGRLKSSEKVRERKETGLIVCLGEEEEINQLRADWEVGKKGCII